MSDSRPAPVALVVGASSGIGFAVARALVDKGYRVVCHGKSLAEASPEFGSWLAEHSDVAQFVAIDLLEHDGPRRLVAQALESEPKLDALVVSAAMTIHRPIDQLDTEDWATLYQLNVQVPFFLAQAAFPALVAAQGSVVFLSSTNALRVTRNNIAYDSSKAALTHLAKALALEWKSEGVRVNVVLPGGVDTPMLASWLEDYSGSEEAAQEARQRGVEERLIAQPGDIAQPIVFLLSESAAWVTGATLVVDGGQLLEG